MFKKIKTFFSSIFKRTNKKETWQYKGLTGAEKKYQKYIDALPKPLSQERVLIQEVYTVNGVSLFTYTDLSLMPASRRFEFEYAQQLSQLGLTPDFYAALRASNDDKTNAALIQELLYRYDNPPHTAAIIETALQFILIDGENPYAPDADALTEKRHLLATNAAINAFFLSTGLHLFSVFANMSEAATLKYLKMREKQIAEKGLKG